MGLASNVTLGRHNRRQRWCQTHTEEKAALLQLFCESFIVSCSLKYSETTRMVCVSAPVHEHVHELAILGAHPVRVHDFEPPAHLEDIL